MSGASMLVLSWNRTWSLPRPVAPWKSTPMPSAWRCDRIRLTVTGRAMLVVFQ